MKRKGQMFLDAPITCLIASQWLIWLVIDLWQSPSYGLLTLVCLLLGTSLAWCQEWGLKKLTKGEGQLTKSELFLVGNQGLLTLCLLMLKSWS